ncbi:MAG TPA: hypothetical protein VJH88_02705 [Candidatus Nanoarchaeia archaeon]|nr:hypothetical protein [Candidatus Nanoarchaeia archaeon]
MFLVVQCPDCRRCQVTQGKSLKCKYCNKGHKIVGKDGLIVPVRAQCETAQEAAAIVRGLNEPSR